MNANFARLEIAGESNTGPIRHHNEDNFLICALPEAPAVLAAVADGIGGHSRGETASYICCRGLLQKAMERNYSMWNRDFLVDTLLEINAKIFDFNLKNRSLRPMGCTVAAALFFRDKVICASAGDSRIYEFNRVPGSKPLRQLTTDHRPEGYEELLNSGKLLHVSLVGRSLGTEKHLQIDTLEIPRPENARYMICSDGLYHHLPEQVLAGVLGSNKTPRETVSILVREAMLAGERDNISVICAAPAGKEI